MDKLKQLLTKENIEVKTVPYKELYWQKQHTKWVEGKGTIYVPYDLERQGPLEQLLELNHKYKSVAGLRDNDKYMVSLFELDLLMLNIVGRSGGSKRIIGKFRREYQRRLRGVRERIQAS